MRSSSLRRHVMDVHRPTQKQECHICHKLFKTANSLTTHMIVIHRVFKSKPKIDLVTVNVNATEMT